MGANMRQFLFGASIAFVVSSAALAATPTLPAVLGVTIGQPIPFPECPKNDHGGHDVMTVEADCWIPSDQTSDGNTFELELSLASEIKTLHLSFITLHIDNDKVDEIFIETDGNSYQEYFMSALRAKFGKPTTVRTKRLQNQFGATFSGIDATWKRPGFTAAYTSAAGRLDSGVIMVSSPDYDRHQLEGKAKPSL
jgi:hypothetical protein